MAKAKTPSKKEVPIELGFLEDEDPSKKLVSGFFPSKFGGLPAWLDLRNVPTGADLKCSLCNGHSKFLLQVYAPLDASETFHRTIFIFLCSNKTCCVERNSNKNLIALRCQLQRENDFYSSDPPKERDPKVAELSPTQFDVFLCRVCGAKSTDRCGACKTVFYCGPNHQTLHWKNGHKEECKDTTTTPVEPKEPFWYKEQEIVIDTEVIPKQTSKERSEKERLEEFQKLVIEGKSGTLDDSGMTKDMLEAASYKSDKAFNKFKKRVAYHPDQILRYDRKGSPLWVAAEKKLDNSEVPPCPYCKGPRVFEFQVMPQLLNSCGQDAIYGDLDWGTLAVYTCEKSCDLGPPYKTEFIWQQDFKPDGQEDD